MKNKIFKEIAEIRIRMGIGVGWFYEIKSALLISASIKILLDLNILISIFLTCLTIFSFYLAGAFDIKFLKIYQFINELSTSKYNPHLNKINKL